jgi:hypothetical protein
MPARALVSLVLGVMMFMLGMFVALRPLLAHGRAVTGARWLEVAIGVVLNMPLVIKKK